MEHNIHVLRETHKAVRVDGQTTDDQIVHLHSVERTHDGFNAADLHHLSSRSLPPTARSKSARAIQ